MKDKNGKTIEAGHLVKRCGYVTYADGPRYKVSKKTWQVSKIEDGQIYYRNPFIGADGQIVDEEVPLKIKENIDVLVVGDENGLYDEFQPTNDISEGSVGIKYRVHKDVPEKNWKEGDIVMVHGKVSQASIDSGVLEQVPDSVKHQHVIVVVDPVKLSGNVNQ